MPLAEALAAFGGTSVSRAVKTFLIAVTIALAILSLRGMRWAYVAFVVLALLRIPARTDFRLRAPSCNPELSADVVAQSLTNVPHIVLFALFFLLTFAQFGGGARRHGWAAVITLAVGAIVELEQGATRTGNCDLHDMIPNALGVVAGMCAVLAWRSLRRARESARPR